MEFHQTYIGRKFFESDFPRLVEALKQIADALEKQIDKKLPGKDMIPKAEINTD